MRRPIQELVNIFSDENKKELCNCAKQQVSSGVHVSLFKNLNVEEYVIARSEYCSRVHKQPCTNCTSMLSVLHIIQEMSFCLLSEAFKVVSPGHKYTAEIARRKLLQMPLVAIRIGKPNEGQSFTVLMEMFPDTDYTKIAMLINTLESKQKASSHSHLEKSVVKLLLGIAQSDRERACMKYAIVNASNMTSSQARKTYGFQNIPLLNEKVNDALVTSQRIHEAIEDLVQVQDKSLLISMGIADSDSSAESEVLDEMTEDFSGTLNSEPEPDKTASMSTTPDLCQTMQQSYFNWFEFYEKLEHTENVDVITEEFFSRLSSLGFTEPELSLITQSRNAFIASQKLYCHQKRAARAINGEVVSDSTDSECGQDYANLQDPLSSAGIKLIKKKRAAVRRKARRLRAKKIAEEHLLVRKVCTFAYNNTIMHLCTYSCFINNLEQCHTFNFKSRHGL